MHLRYFSKLTREMARQFESFTNRESYKIVLHKTFPPVSSQERKSFNELGVKKSSFKMFKLEYWNKTLEEMVESKIQYSKSFEHREVDEFVTRIF